ncbi:MAG: DUF2867 domain-containing protein [Prolixibacteraceae bacterium]|nr:DUF2867 domain-containing protein [Prolixibacteraceae bacterium]MBN2648593.1 DUF2867 domain-containing protein [Prolixibacteraceae bacterium]
MLQIKQIILNKIEVYTKPPSSSIILNNFGKVDYCDSYKVHLTKNILVDVLAKEMFGTKNWTDKLLDLRNFVVRIFGLKTSGSHQAQSEIPYSEGSKMGVFTVECRNEHEIVMAENDKHLNFKTSVLTIDNETGINLYFTTIVHFNNIGGRLYFIPVKPFHRIIIKSSIKRIINKLKSS